MAGLVLGHLVPATWTTTLAACQLRITHGVPVRLRRFLEDARARGILHADGAAYTFRSPELAQHLLGARGDGPGPPRRATLLLVSATGVAAVGGVGWLGLRALFRTSR